jgi:hypothetical protein
VKLILRDCACVEELNAHVLKWVIILYIEPVYYCVVEEFRGLAVKLLILGPSFRRNSSNGVLPAIQRYDGLFYRIARKYLKEVRNVDVLVMKDNLTLVNAKTRLSYAPPKGQKWTGQSISEEDAEKARVSNEIVLSKKIKKGGYSEVFVAMGKKYAEALPDLLQYNVKVVFPTRGGIGPKAQVLKEWLSRGH